ncbi:MAG: hypothetical protein ACKOPN_10345 [Prochlorococcaceae cyanobacterium]|jgi:hypothetical protein
MREIPFQLVEDTPGCLRAEARLPAGGPMLRITAPSLEELQHEARDALIQHFGQAHGAYRVVIRRPRPQAASTIRPLHEGPFMKSRCRR